MPIVRATFWIEIFGQCCHSHQLERSQRNGRPPSRHKKGAPTTGGALAISISCTDTLGLRIFSHSPTTETYHRTAQTKRPVPDSLYRTSHSLPVQNENVCVRTKSPDGGCGVWLPRWGSSSSDVSSVDDSGDGDGDTHLIVLCVQQDRFLF